MKKTITILMLVLLSISCKNKAEQMLFDYQQKNVSSLNFDLDDLDFKINKIEKIADITAQDSMKLSKVKLAQYWTKEPSESVIDTISFAHMKVAFRDIITQREKLLDVYKKAYEESLKWDDWKGYSLQQEYSEGRMNTAKDLNQDNIMLSEIISLEAYYSKLAENPDSVLSSKYKANYSVKNPMLGNTKQTFNKIFYTNATQTEFIKEEIVE